MYVGFSEKELMRKLNNMQENTNKNPLRKSLRQENEERANKTVYTYTYILR